MTYSTKAFVRVRKPLNTWVDWNRRLGGGPSIVVHTQGVEISAPQGMMLENRHLVLPAERATMRLDRVGWAGTPLGRRKCIRISGRDRDRPIEVAISPESDINETWQALIDSGFMPSP